MSGSYPTIIIQFVLLKKKEGEMENHCDQESDTNDEREREGERRREEREMGPLSLRGERE